MSACARLFPKKRPVTSGLIVPSAPLIGRMDCFGPDPVSEVKVRIRMRPEGLCERGLTSVPKVSAKYPEWLKNRSLGALRLATSSFCALKCPRWCPRLAGLRHPARSISSADLPGGLFAFNLPSRCAYARACSR